MNKPLTIMRMLRMICWKYRRGLLVGSAFLMAAILTGFNLVVRNDFYTFIDFSTWLWVLFLGALIAVVVNLLND